MSPKQKGDETSLKSDLKTRAKNKIFPYEVPKVENFSSELLLLSIPKKKYSNKTTDPLIEK